MTPDKPRLLREWMKRAERNLQHAEMPLGDGAAENDAAEVECYYAQQAAEMAVKAVYVARDIPFEYTHNIRFLLDELGRKGVVIPDEVNEARELTGYATVTHYPLKPMEVPRPLTEEHREEAARVARAVVEWAKAEIARKPK